MAKYVIDTTIVLDLLDTEREPSPDHKLMAPTLIRSEVLAELFESVRKGRLARDTALAQLARFSEMKIRYLGDRVLRRRAWSVAERLGWASVGRAEYIALVQLQADALVTLDNDLAAEVAEIVETAPISAIL